MGLSDIIYNIISLGGHGRCCNAQRKFDALYSQYKQLYNEVKNTETFTNKLISDLGNNIENAMEIVYNAQSILSRQYQNSISENNFSIDKPLEQHRTLVGYKESQEFIVDYRTILASIGGAGVGGSLAIGTYTLVSTFGVASTGTAIITLSGISAHNATLAILGGGTLASGAAGVAGGMLTLGGIVIVPAIIAGITHAKASAIKAESRKVEQAIDKLKEEKNNLINIQAVVKSKIQIIKSASSDLYDTTKRIGSILFPWSLFSCIFRRSRSWLGGKYYSDNENLHLQELDTSLSKFVKVFKQKS